MSSVSDNQEQQVPNLDAGHQIHYTTPLPDALSEKSPVKDVSFDVRVLLARQNAHAFETWTLRSEHGFSLLDTKRYYAAYETSKKQLSIAMRKGRLYLNGRLCKSNAVTIRPQNGHIGFADNDYDGAFMIVRSGANIYLINMIDIEKYVFSVLRWEGWPGWPLEVNKVFAIMCRTYVMHKVLEARKQKKQRYYDIRCTNIHQTYKGVHTHKNIQDAINATRGVVVAYNQKPILAMYDSCCGGVVPAKLHTMDFDKVPYLQRTYPCTFCRSCKLYKWELAYTLSDFEDLLKAGVDNCIPVYDVTVSKRDDAQVVKEVHVKTHSSCLAVTGNKIYSIFKNIKSLCFSIKKEGKRIVFTGHGYGHHLGLCQWGTRQMVREGWDCKSILRFFYPDTTFMKVRVKSDATV